MIESNEPAFPVSDVSKTQCPGLTKREYFAAMALQGMLANHGAYEEPDDKGGVEVRPVNPPEVAEYSVKYADALIAALQPVKGATNV